MRLTTTDINMQLTCYYQNTGSIFCWVEAKARHGSLPIPSTDNTVFHLPVNIQESNELRLVQQGFITIDRPARSSN